LNNIITIDDERIHLERVVRGTVGETLSAPGMQDMRFREPLVDQLLYAFPRPAPPATLAQRPTAN
jgi:hypothetical protein